LSFNRLANVTPVPRRSSGRRGTSLASASSGSRSRRCRSQHALRLKTLTASSSLMGRQPSNFASCCQLSARVCRLAVRKSRPHGWRRVHDQGASTGASVLSRQAEPLETATVFQEGAKTALATMPRFFCELAPLFWRSLSFRLAKAFSETPRRVA
jgi:hypothetical protein